MNDTNAEKILEEEHYPNGASCPTIRVEYICPCRCGKIIYEQVVGFDDRYIFIDCPECNKKYKILTGNGHIWKLVEK